MLTRRRILISSVAVLVLPLAECAQAQTTLQQIVADIQKACNFLTSWQNVAAVVVTVISGFNAAAGAAASVAIGVAQQVESMVCAAVMAKVAANSQVASENVTVGSTVTVVVNGVPVVGTITGSH